MSDANDADRYLVRAERARELPGFCFRHPLNPQSEVHIRSLSALIGLERLGLHVGLIRPGKESFVYHFHQYEEEFIYIISGRGRAEIGEQEFDVGPGDVMAFPAPSPGHHLRNPFDEDLVYLMGGERRGFEVGEFPRLGKRAIFDRNGGHIIDVAAAQPFVPRSSADES